MSSRATLKATPNAISSLASADGPLPSVSRDGQTINQSGPAHVHVSRFRAQDAGKAMPTNDTSGPLFTALSISAGLQSSLESKLRTRLDVNGSPEFAMTWRQWDMPAGLPICALRASARPISGSDFGSWQTPAATDGNGGGSAKRLADEQAGNHHALRIRDILAAMRSSGLLIHSGRNVDFHAVLNLWLMGYPREWMLCAAQAMPSSRK